MRRRPARRRDAICKLKHLPALRGSSTTEDSRLGAARIPSRPYYNARRCKSRADPATNHPMKTTRPRRRRLGGYFGGRLAEAGVDVTFLVRPKRREQIRARRTAHREPARQRNGRRENGSRRRSASRLRPWFSSLQGLRPGFGHRGDRSGDGRQVWRGAAIERHRAPRAASTRASAIRR